MSSVSATHENIYRAANELFSCKGCQGTSTRDIAQQACIVELAPFRHFTTKESSFNAGADRLTAAATLEEVLPTFAHMPFENGVHLLAQRYLVKISGTDIRERRNQT